MSGLFNLQKRPHGPRRPWEVRVLIWGAALILGSAIVVTAAYYFDVFTESRYFCGVLCHPNRPQYVAQEVSPHADVECGVCHVGPGLPAKVMAKIAGTRELALLVTNTYERPIPHPVNQLRTADVICVQCHSQQQPYEDQIERISVFAADESNSETQITMAMYIGGGGSVSGAHWHIDHPVSFIARDVDRQDIPWAAMTGPDGEEIVYEQAGDPLTAQEKEELPVRQMDCMDCHNRATHDFRPPEEVLDEALAAGRIDRDLPYVKREAMALLSASYATQEEGLRAMEDLGAFYQSNYAQVYAGRQPAIAQAVETLKEIYGQTTFPAMNVDWRVYPNNLGHTDFPGCFRCHDGEHENTQEEAIPSNCTLCHSAPVAVEQGGQISTASIVDAFLAVEEKPASHLESSFAWQHRLLADPSCAGCHGPIEYGTDNSSFCANGVCHGQEWPGLAAAAAFQHPVPLVGAHAQISCNECHQRTELTALDDCAACHQPPDPPHFGPECATCHSPFGWQSSAAAWLAVASQVPHRVDTAVDCLTCHQDGLAVQVPPDHAAFPEGSCLECHDSAWDAEALAIPHEIEERDNCLVCHGEGKLRPVPPDHEEWGTDLCLLCHVGTSEQ